MKRANREALNQKAAENQHRTEEQRIKAALDKARRDTDQGNGSPTDR